MKKFFLMMAVAIVTIVMTSCSKSAEEYAEEYDAATLQVIAANESGDEVERDKGYAKQLKIYNEASENLNEEELAKFVKLINEKTKEHFNDKKNGADISEAADSAATAQKAKSLENKAKGAVDDAADKAKDLLN